MSGSSLLSRAGRLERIGHTLGRVARMRWPAFLFGGRVAAGEVPVFTYHEADPDDFEGDLAFLADNGYRTLSLEEFLAGERPPRSVLITFDDARLSFHRVALPLLRRYRMRAALFVPTAWVGRRETSATGREAAFMDWEQIRECEESPWVDVESHAHRHALVPVRERLVAFASPATLDAFDIYDWPLLDENGPTGFPPPGTPVFSASPILSADHALLPDPGAVRACREAVAEEGAGRFFSRPDAERRLEAVYLAALGGRPPLAPMPEERFEALLVSEFEASRDAFLEHLGRPPRVLAYPWMLGSRRSLELAREFGMQAVFGVGIDFRPEPEKRGVLPVHGRYKDLWLRHLPGRGRSSLGRLAARRVAALVKGGHLAH